MTPRRRPAIAGLALAVAALPTYLPPMVSAASPSAGSAAPAAAGVSVQPDVADLPRGALPRLPYVDWPGKRIVDGNRRVSIAGIKARVVSLHKVDGGYLLGRELADGNDLVLVRTNGARRVLVAGWQAPRRASLSPGLAVGRDGDEVVVNTVRRAGEAAVYADTRVVSLPGGTVLRQRDFGAYAPSLLGYGTDRALLSVSSEEVEPPPGSWPDTRWWTPATDTLTTVREDASGESADLSAWEWAVRPASGAYSVEGIPPDTSPSWVVEPEDVRLGPWSPDDTMVAGNNEVTDDDLEASAYLVRRTADGAAVLSVRGNQDPQVTWESDTALLLRTRVSAGQYQLVRCFLSGACQRVGARTTDRRGVVIPATRRNS